MAYTEKQKGSSLYLTIIFLGLILAISVGTTSIVVSGASLISGMGDSVKSFHVADTGLEEALYEIRKGAGKDVIISLGGELDCSLNFSYQYGDIECNVVVNEESGQVFIDSTSSYNGSKRRIEAVY